MYILDTDHLSVLERGGAASLDLQLKLSSVPAEQVTTTIVSYEEQMRGWLARAAKARTIPQIIESYERLQAHIATFASVKLLTFDSTAAIHLKALHDARIPIGTMDRRIAAIVLANGAVLLTRNLIDFRKVPDLLVEDWTA